MDILFITFQAVFSLLGIGVLGFWIIGRRRVPGSTLGFLASLAIDIALPFLVLSNLVRDFSVQNFPDWWRMPLWWAGFTIVSLTLSMVTSFMVRKEIRSEFTISLFFQNGIFFPLIIITGLFGPGNELLVSLFLFMTFHPPMVFSTYAMFFGKRGQGQKLSLHRIINPVLVATIIGVIIGLTSINQHVPGFILSILTMVGAMATPLFMLILGGNVYNDFMFTEKEKKRFHVWDLVKFMSIKNLVFPLVFLGLLIALRPDNTVAFIILLQASVPPITAIPIFAERLGGNRAIASEFIVGSFIFSVISIPAMIYLFSMFFPLPL